MDKTFMALAYTSEPFRILGTLSAEGVLDASAIHFLSAEQAEQAVAAHGEQAEHKAEAVAAGKLADAVQMLMEAGL